MRDVSMVDTSRWDQSFVEVDSLSVTKDLRRGDQLIDFVIGLGGGNSDTSKWLTNCMSNIDNAKFRSSCKSSKNVDPVPPVLLPPSRTMNGTCVSIAGSDATRPAWSNRDVSADDLFLAQQGQFNGVDRTRSADRIYQNTAAVDCFDRRADVKPPLAPRRASADRVACDSRTISPSCAAAASRLNQPNLSPSRRSADSAAPSPCPASPLSPSAVGGHSRLVPEQAAPRQSPSPIWDQPQQLSPSTSAGSDHVEHRRRETSTANVCISGSVADAAYSQVASFLPQWDQERLEVVYRRLVACGFYFGRMSINEATERLSRWPVGSFLLRDSSDSRYLFSVSIQTCRGTTSIRMAYRSGLFRLDCSPDQEHLMPTFDCALRLIAHYVRLCAAASTASAVPPSSSSSGSAASNVDARSASTPAARNGHSYVLLESSGRKDTPVLLTQPYREQPASLAHLCRRTVQRRLAVDGCGDSARDAAVDRLHLIPSLKTYLKDYPYDL